MTAKRCESKKKLNKNTAHERIVVVERRAIDQRTTISLVRVDAREMVIVAQHNAIAVEILPEVVEKRPFVVPPIAGSASSFAKPLKNGGDS